MYTCAKGRFYKVQNIQIVKNSVVMKYFASHGLPVWILDDWKELDEYKEEILKEKYNIFIKQANWDTLYMDFWIEKTTLSQKKYKDN